MPRRRPGEPRPAVVPAGYAARHVPRPCHPSPALRAGPLNVHHRLPLVAALAVACGAALGALLRWALGLQFDGVLPALPAGTLLANLAGGYLVGAAVAFFAARPALSPAWRLLVITGFLGGLTTFSGFSAEVATQLLQGQAGWALAAAGLHVLGSLAMTLLGMATVARLRGAGQGGAASRVGPD
jgi:fluoride exporter